MNLITNVAEKLNTVREACPGMPEEVYIFTEYLAQHANSELYPTGVVVMLLGAIDDFQNERCGFACNREQGFPEELRGRGKEILAQACYILQVFDAVFDEEAAQIIRTDCEQALGWNVPRRVTFVTEQEYPDCVKAAIDWWSETLQHPKMDNGDSQLTMLMAMFGGNAFSRNITVEQLEKFRHILAEDLTAELERSRSVRLGVDYGPSGVLAHAASEAELDGFAFPCKTCMHVSTGEVKVSYGYGAPYSVIWSA